jgi:trimethylamine:corrinoid methyltransferase-like protein
LEVIEKVGIGNNFPTESHTFEHLETKRAQATIVDRRRSGAWEKRGSKNPIATNGRRRQCRP